jgi:hypothetical protein
MELLHDDDDVALESYTKKARLILLFIILGIQDVVGRCYFFEEADTSHKEGRASSQKRVDPARIPYMEFFLQEEPKLSAKARPAVGKNE